MEPGSLRITFLAEFIIINLPHINKKKTVLAILSFVVHGNTRYFNLAQSTYKAVSHGGKWGF